MKASTKLKLLDFAIATCVILIILAFAGFLLLALYDLCT